MTFFVGVAVGMFYLMFRVDPSPSSTVAGLILTVPPAIVLIADCICVLLWGKAKLDKDPNDFKDE